MRSFKKSMIICAIPLFLIGCSDKFAETANQNATNDSTGETAPTEKEEETAESNKEPSTDTIQNALDQHELEKKKVVDNDFEIEEKENYTDPGEFAKYVSYIVFEFQNGVVSPEEYYQFIYKHGSNNLLESYPETKENTVIVLQTLQETLLQSRNKTNEYVISEVGFNRNQKEGYYYRMEKEETASAYYITTIVLEDDVWKFEDDSPSQPFEIAEDEVLDEKEMED